MSIRVVCPSCHKVYTLDESMQGKNVRCRACQSAIVKSVRPIFLTKNGEKMGNWHGPVPAAPITVKAKPGYVVSEVSLRAALSLDALRLTFAKLGTNPLDLKDNSNSEWVGGNGGRPSSIGGKGALFVGVTGNVGPDGSPSSLGLVAVLPKE
ncbi:MAG: hypothetical protein ACRELG_18080 [Gemmataceae bacterium]